MAEKKKPISLQNDEQRPRQENPENSPKKNHRNKVDDDDDDDNNNNISQLPLKGKEK